MEKNKRVKIQSPEELLEKNIISSIQTKKELLVAGPQLREFSRAAFHVVKCYRNGGRLYIAGNGGSAADAQHLAAEFVSKLSRDREPLPAEALTVDTSVLTAIGNDYGYDQIFARQVFGKITKRDIFLGITTSGKSPNILKALEACRTKEIPTIVFTGNDGGDALQLADYCIIAPGNCTAKIQEIHILLAHSLCEYVEIVLFN
jgi:D-sedoheptulose 7-phosphate isomerase